MVSFVTLKQNMKFATYLDAMAAALLGTLGLLGIFLSAVGLYGVVAQSVVRRTREIGIRVAIGAEPRKVVGMVLGEGFRLALVGVGLGLAAAVAGAVAISSLLFGVKPADPLVVRVRRGCGGCDCDSGEPRSGPAGEPGGPGGGVAERVSRVGLQPAKR